MSTKIKASSGDVIFKFSSFIIAFYFLTFFVVNSYARSNGLSDRELLKPQKWFGPENDIVITASVTPKVVPTGIPTPFDILNNDHILELINEYRINNGKQKLERSDELCKLAEGRADFLMKDRMKGYRESKLGNHSGFKTMTSGYSGTGIGENIGANLATGFKDNPSGNYSGFKTHIVSNQDVSAVKQWKLSPPHNKLLLSSQEGQTILSKACIANRVEDYGMLTIFLVGDK